MVSPALFFVYYLPMPQIIVPNQAPLNPKETISMNAMAIPSFRRLLAEQRRNSHKILIHPCGGLGDEICAEPAIRWAIKEFKDKCDIYLLTRHKELYQHLEFKKVFDENKHTPDLDNFYVFQSYADSSHLKFEFVNHMNTQCVDYASLIMFALQIPDPRDKCILLKPSASDYQRVSIRPLNDVVIHAGKTWQSRTIPPDFWADVILGLKKEGITPILIGSESSDGKGYLDISAEGCLDYRGKLSVMETVALLHDSRVFLTNDSAPLHMAASSPWSWIGFIATAKHPDYISHWRKLPNLNRVEWAWRMQNFSKGGMWETMNTCPNNKNDIMLDKVDPELLRSWLPEPSEMVSWAKEKLCI